MKSDIFHPLSNLYIAMDQAWNHTAALYDFQCEGCEDNCCRSLFFHHTFVEKAFLLQGFDQLTPLEREKALARARTYCDKTFSGPGPGISLKLMCPLNQVGKCILYPYRPMICRLHGLPHELHPPGQPPRKGPGCHAGPFDSTPYIPFDRTIFYREMAKIEMQFKPRAGKTGRIKETIAQMVIL